MASMMERARAEVLKVRSAVARGELDVRGDAEGLTGEAREIVTDVNGIVAALVGPMRVAAGAIRQIATGVIPDFVIDDQNGEFNDIKRSVNTFLAVMFGMHYEIQSLIEAIGAGSLTSRGNDWDFEGVWRDLIAGINDTIEAVVSPIREASAVLDRLAKYELWARVQGRYKGEHARIKRSLNATAGSLHDAVSRVAGAVAEVSAVGGGIERGSEAIAAGASVQAKVYDETVANLGRISDAVRQTVASAEEARTVATEANAAARKATESVREMTSVMGETKASAEGTASILAEIDGIASQTDSLATRAMQEATKVSASGRGFAVVADQVRALSTRSSDAAEQVREGTAAAGNGGGEASGAAVKDAIREIEQVAFQTRMLALNAAVEAAHLGAASGGFAKLTREVRALAQRSRDAASRTEALTTRAVGMAASGVRASDEIRSSIEAAALAVAHVAKFVDGAADTAQRQQQSVSSVVSAMDRMRDVIARSEEESATWRRLAADLSRQMSSLRTLVERFRLEKPAPAA